MDGSNKDLLGISFSVRVLRKYGNPVLHLNKQFEDNLKVCEH